MKAWEYAIWAVILVGCLVVGVWYSPQIVPEPVVGVVRFEGAIDFAAADQLINLLEAARQDPTVAAVVLEVLSPGGLATSSESVFYTLLRLRAEKPVVVVVDGLAASGGYYIAAAANRIYVPASASIGNIGTRGGRPKAPYISPLEMSTGPYKFAGGSFFDQINQLDLVKEAFVNNVIAQRINSPVNPLKLDKRTIQEGRLYLGSEAVAVGLADLEGGRTDAILAAAELAGLPHYRVEQLAVYLGIDYMPEEEYQATVAKMAATAPPDAVFLLDSRIALPGLQESDAVRDHMLNLRRNAPMPWALPSVRGLPAASPPAVSPPALQTAPAAKEGS